MRHTHILVVALFALAACQKQIIDDGSEAPAQEETVQEDVEYYTVADVLLHTDQLPTGSLWVAGFVVGHTTGSMSNARFSATAATHSNILLAPTPDDHTHLLPVELSTKAMQQALSLMHNPDSLQRGVRIKGHVSTYYRVIGLRSIEEYKWLGEAPWLRQEWPDDNGSGNGDGDGNNNGDNNSGDGNDDGGNDNGETMPGIIKAGTDGVFPCGIDIDTRMEREGNEFNPYLPSDLLKLGDAFPDTAHPWIYGYAVGYTDKTWKFHYTATGAATDNILVSDTPTGCTEFNTIVVELQDEPMRQAMSLAAQPQRLGSLVRFYGAAKRTGIYRKHCLQTNADYSADWLITQD